MGESILLRRSSPAFGSHGRLPFGYTELSYIQSSGTQFINTGVASNSSDYTEISISLKDYSPVSQSALFGGEGATKTGTGIRYYADGDNASIFKLKGMYKGNLNASDYGSGNCTLRLYASSGNYFAETNVGTYQLATSGGDVSVNMYIFGLNRNGSLYNGASIKVSEFYIKNGSIYVRNFVPCKNLSNVVGMYDLVTQSFFTNSGSGSFIAGDPV